VAKKHTIKRRSALAMAVVGCAMTGAAGTGTWAQAQAQAQAPVALVVGEVVKIDRVAGRVTLKHGEIRSLDMPPMTLAWRAAQPRLLEDLAVGDRVRFAPARIDGQYTITTLSKAQP
jgi:Cu/Ag efflux protein CusF